MAIKLHKSRKHNSKKHNSKKNNSRKHYTKKTKKNNHSRRHNKSKSRNNKHKMQRGGFATNCNLASVKEPAFKVPALGDASGLSIPESRGAIYRPNCQADTYQAMTP